MLRLPRGLHNFFGTLGTRLRTSLPKTGNHGKKSALACGWQNLQSRLFFGWPQHQALAHRLADQRKAEQAVLKRF